MEANGGRISVESQLGQGTSFVVEFPLLRGNGDGGTDARPSQEKLDGAELSPDGRRADPRLEMTILQQIQRALRLVLREAGYEVIVTGSGEEALDRAGLAGPTRAAIVDLMLPDMHRIEVCRQLRSWSEIPILVLSALGEEAIKIEALESGASGEQLRHEAIRPG